VVLVVAVAGNDVEEAVDRTFSYVEANWCSAASKRYIVLSWSGREMQRG
jgi:hypothetical protein